jgi:ribosomal protein S17E
MFDPKIETEKFLEEFRSFSSKELKNEIDVFNLIEAIFKKDQYQLLEDIAFTSKYCVGLYKILGQSSTEITEEYKKDITENFTETIKKIKELLNAIISEFNEFERESFKSRYFEMSQSSLNNLFSLINDFSEIKLFLNSKKRHAF